MSALAGRRSSATSRLPAPVTRRPSGKRISTRISSRVAYNPGRAARVNSAMLAAAIKDRAGKDVTFTLATRDMNKLALQSQLLGAQLLGLENVIVVAGDPFNRRDEGLVKEAADVRPTQLIQEISNMNQGRRLPRVPAALPHQFLHRRYPGLGPGH